MFKRFRLPRKMVPGNDKQCTSQQCEGFVGRYQVEQLRFARYHTQSNGLEQPVVRTIKDALAKISSGDFVTKLVKVLPSCPLSLLSAGK